MSNDLMFSENYLRWALDTKHEPLTRTQKEFAEFLFFNHNAVSVIGNLTSVFIDVRKWIKHSEHFFIEEKLISLPPEVLEFDPKENKEWSWDDIEVEEKFDWSMSMKDIEQKYLSKKSVKHKPKNFKELKTEINPLVEKASIDVDLFDFEKPLYEDFVLTPKKSKNQRKAFCIGFLKKKYNEQARENKKIYYDEFEDRYIIDFAHVQLTFTPKYLYDYIKYNKRFPNGFNKKIIETESPNFHEDFTPIS